MEETWYSISNNFNMAIQSRPYLQGQFKTSAKPTQQDFTDLTDSYLHVADNLPVAGVLAAITAAPEQDLRLSLRNAASVLTGRTIFVDTDVPKATDTRTGTGVYNATVPFKTIQAAVNAAAPGDVVIVNHGTYNESVTVPQPMTLVYHHAIHDGGAASAVRYAGPPDTHLNIELHASILRNTGDVADPVGTAVVYSTQSYNHVSVNGTGGDAARGGFTNGSGQFMWTGCPCIYSVNSYGVYLSQANSYTQHGSITNCLIFSENSIACSAAGFASIQNCYIKTRSVNAADTALYAPIASLSGCTVIAQAGVAWVMGAIAYSNTIVYAEDCYFESAANYGLTGGFRTLKNCTVSSQKQCILSHIEGWAPRLLQVIACTLYTADPAAQSNIVITWHPSATNNSLLLTKNIINKATPVVYGGGAVNEEIITGNVVVTDTFKPYFF